MFHVFDDAKSRARFAARVASLSWPEGLWLSVIGSTEGPLRKEGPPRRSAVDIVTAIEPALEIVSLRSTAFHGGDAFRAWGLPVEAHGRGDVHAAAAPCRRMPEVRFP